MSKFVRTTGTNLHKTFRFSMVYNALNGQVGHSLKAAEAASISIGIGFNRVTDSLFIRFLVYFCGCKRHFDPDNEFVT